MLQLSPDPTFHYELLRVLGSARYSGADISEVLRVASQLTAGDFSSWHDEFKALADWVYSTVAEGEGEHHDRVTVRDAMFRASSYYRAADFFLHGNAADPRIMSLWEKQTSCFDRAIALMDLPGERRMLKADGFDVPIIVFRASMDDTPRPTVLLHNGFDGAMEEMLHVHGFAALERGINVVLYEGPGQPSVRRYQDLGFIPEWEKVVLPVMDYVETLPFVDAKKIGLAGYSMGGFLCVRAAAFEHRLATVMAVDGIYDVYGGFTKLLPPHMKQYLNDGNAAAFNTGAEELMEKYTNLRWALEQAQWSFKASHYEGFVKLKAYTMQGLCGQVACPVFVGNPEHDQFFQGQPDVLVKELGEKATMVRFTDAEGAGTHCHVGAGVLLNGRVFDWFQGVVGK